MKALIQRVKEAQVDISGKNVSKIGVGMMILLGVVEGDTDKDIEWLASKCAAMRIFPDDNGVMNRSISEAGGEILVVSQFTLAADIRKGNRPSYIRAMRPPESEEMYECFCRRLAEISGCRLATGVFGADMDVKLVNHGPVTIIADSTVMSKK